MAGRRRKSEIDGLAEALYRILTSVPIWVGPIAAVVFFLIFQFVVPVLFALSNEQTGSVISTLSKKFAPWIAVAVLVIWILAEIRKYGTRMLLDSRSNVEGLRSLSWQEFERLVGESYRRKGYVVQETGGSRADGGFDLILEKAGQRVLVQCKRWKTWKVGVSIIRELYGVVQAEGASRGIVVTSGRFTRDAVRFSQDKPLDLIDGNTLWKMISEVQTPGARASTAHGMKRDVASNTEANPTCPSCGSEMVLRTATRGKHAGNRFYGCSQYPRCKTIKPVNADSSSSRADNTQSARR